MAKPYDQDAAQTLCDRLAHGEPLGAICDDPAMPGLEDLADWRKQADFRTRLARARQTRAEVLFDQILPIVDGTEAGRAGAGDPAPLSPKERVEARKWLLAHLDPKRFGEKPAALRVRAKASVKDKREAPSLLHLLTDLPRAERNAGLTADDD